MNIVRLNVIKLWIFTKNIDTMYYFILEKRLYLINYLIKYLVSKTMTFVNVLQTTKL